MQGVDYGVVAQKEAISPTILDKIRIEFGIASGGVLDTVSRRSLVTGLPLVTGEIVGFKFNKGHAAEFPWGESVPVGQRIGIVVYVRYHASGAYGTRVIADVYSPSGVHYQGIDDDAWPYESPSITFKLLPGSFIIDEEGVWEAELTYVKP